MILEIQHETCFEYTSPIREWLAEFRMEPVSDQRQRCHSFQLAVSQASGQSNYVDGFGNRVHHFNIVSPNQLVRVLSSSVVETEHLQVHPMYSEVDFPMDHSRLPLEALGYLQLSGPTAHNPLLDEVIESLRPVPGERMGKWIWRLAEHIRENYRYERFVTDASSTIEVLLKEKKGVCQDFTHLLIALARSQGIPARYISGYIHRDNKESQSHAWCEVWLPDVGWSGLDPTNGSPIHEHFVKIAIGRDFTDVPPNKGTYRGDCQEKMETRVATRELKRLPSVSWREQLPSLDGPIQTFVSDRPEQPTDEQIVQQQQQQQQT